MYDYGVWILNYVEQVSFDIYDWALVFGLAFLMIELLHDLVARKLDKKTWRETFGSLFTNIPYYFSETLLFSSVVVVFFIIYEYIPWQLPVTWWMLAITILLADLVYYIEHRLAHRIRVLWVAHTVHHSAQIMNTSTAFRFSIFDPLISAALYFPLIFMGIHPVFIIAGELFVLAYQFWIHTDLIPKLGFLEKFLNTPSSHRVHHARDPRYRDANYGGILIIWDRIFGTYRAEDKKLEYGLPQQINSWNPITVQLHEVPRLLSDLRRARGLVNKCKVLFGPPLWLQTQEKILDDKI